MLPPAAPHQADAALDALNCEQTEAQLIQAGADIAQAVTGSRIAYLHFLNDDQDTIELGAWSHDTRGYCTATYDRHYPISSAGIWADSARLRRPCIHNDYAAVTNKRGLPEGHSPLQRHLGVVVEDEGKVRLLVGVGNKEAPYGEADVAALERVARRIWSVVRQRRMVERLLDVERRFVHLQALARVCAWEYDPGVDRIGFDSLYGTLFGAAAGSLPPATLSAWLARVAPADRPRLLAALTAGQAERPQLLRVEALREDGRGFPAQIRFECRRRGIGQGLIVVGIVQDLSEQTEAEDLRRLAETDALTGLPNRRRLEALFAETSPAVRRARDRLAVHFVDLDDFKPVNDRHGHAMGDAVLRVLARRLQRLLRRDDFVARVGGDEFVVVQTAVQGHEGAEALAGKIVAALCRPVHALGLEVSVGACVGIAIRGGAEEGLSDLSARADRALYRAKAAGGRCWRLDGSA